MALLHLRTIDNYESQITNVRHLCAVIIFNQTNISIGIVKNPSNIFSIILPIKNLRTTVINIIDHLVFHLLK